MHCAPTEQLRTIKDPGERLFFNFVDCPGLFHLQVIAGRSHNSAMGGSMHKAGLFPKSFPFVELIWHHPFELTTASSPRLFNRTAEDSQLFFKIRGNITPVPHFTSLAYLLLQLMTHDADNSVSKPKSNTL